MLKVFMQSKVVRYFLSAGVATIVDISMYFVAFNYIYQKQDVNMFNWLVISAPTASLMLSYTAGLLTNFFFTKHLVFKESSKLVSFISSSDTFGAPAGFCDLVYFRASELCVFKEH